MTNKIKAYVTTLGETVIGEVVSEDKETVELNSALFLRTQQHPQADIVPGLPGVAPQFSPLAAFAAGEILKGTDIILQKQNVVFEHVVHDSILAIYSNIVGKVAIASAGAIKKLDSIIKLR